MTPEQIQAAIDRKRISAAIERRQLGRVESFAQGVGQGLSFGFGDELYGAGAALIPGGQGYDEAVGAARERLERARPGYRFAGEVAGSLVAPGGAAGMVARGGTALARAGRAAAVGAGQAGLAGAGEAEGGLGERATAGIAAAPLGAALGGGAQATLGRFIREAPQLTEEAQEATRRGIRVTSGQATGDLEQLAREAELRGVRGAGQRTMTDFDAGQQQDVARAIEQTGQRVGVRQGADLTTAAGDVVGGVRRAEQAANRATNQAWRDVRSRQSQFLPDERAGAAVDLAQRFRSAIHDDVAGIGLNPETGDFLQRVSVRLLERSGLAGGARQPTIQRIDGLRQGLNAMMRSETVPQRRAGLQRMVQQFDGWLGDSVTRGLMDGDQQTIDALRRARGLTRQYHATFSAGGKGTDRAAGNVIQRMIDEQAGPDEAIRFISGLDQLGNLAGRKALRRIERASPQAYQMLRTGHFQSLTTNPRTGQARTPAQIATQIDRLMASPAMARSLYGADGARDLAGLARALRATDQQMARTGNASRSAYAGANLLGGFARRFGLATSLLSGDPGPAFLSMLTEGLGNIQGLVGARVATSAPRPGLSDRLVGQGIGNVGRLGASE